MRRNKSQFVHRKSPKTCLQIILPEMLFRMFLFLQHNFICTFLAPQSKKKDTNGSWKLKEKRKKRGQKNPHEAKIASGRQKKEGWENKTFFVPSCGQKKARLFVRPFLIDFSKEEVEKLGIFFLLQHLPLFSTYTWCIILCCWTIQLTPDVLAGQIH